MREMGGTDHKWRLHGGLSAVCGLMSEDDLQHVDHHSNNRKFC